jgi:choline dehydrogenase
MQADRVVFDRGRASGVRFLDGTEVHAGTVVLSAGVYGSPAILLRSGIGPADDLRALGLEVAADLAGVGANLVDHPAITYECGVVDDALPAPRLHSIATFRSAGCGSAEPPDLMLWYAEPDTQPDNGAPYDIEIVLLKPGARGRVSLRSADPAEPPRIELPVPTDESDLERLTEGYRIAADVADDPSIRKLCRGSRPAAPTAHELHEQLRAEAYSIPHVVGTCAMGPNTADGAVVDALGRVHGVDQLVVIDASIMPDVPSGFTHIPTIMIAERLSEQLARSL